MLALNSVVYVVVINTKMSIKKHIHQSSVSARGGAGGGWKMINFNLSQDIRMLDLVRFKSCIRTELYLKYFEA